MSRFKKYLEKIRESKMDSIPTDSENLSPDLKKLKKENPKAFKALMSQIG